MISLIPFPNISPVLFSLPIPEWEFSLGSQNYSLGGFEFAIHWYALAYVVGILFASWLIRQTIRRPFLWPQKSPALTEKNLDDLMTWMVIGIIAGGRLGYVIFYKPHIYLADPIAALRIFDGGMSFHGGFLGVIIAGLAFCRKNKISILQVQATKSKNLLTLETLLKAFKLHQTEGLNLLLQCIKTLANKMLQDLEEDKKGS